MSFSFLIKVVYLGTFLHYWISCRKTAWLPQKTRGKMKFTQTALTTENNKTLSWYHKIPFLLFFQLKFTQSSFLNPTWVAMKVKYVIDEHLWTRSWAEMQTHFFWVWQNVHLNWHLPAHGCIWASLVKIYFQRNFFFYFTNQTKEPRSATF